MEKNKTLKKFVKPVTRYVEMSDCIMAGSPGQSKDAPGHEDSKLSTSFTEWLSNY